MSKPIKSMIMREYKDRIGDAQEALLIGIRGLKAKDQVKIRSELSKKKIRVTVVRNALAAKIFEGSDLSKLSGFLTGSNAAVYGGQSIVEVAREIVRFVEKMPNLELKGAVLDGTLYSGKAGVTELSKFPTKDEAIANVVTLVVSPGKKLLAQLKGPGSTVAGIVSAIEQKLEKGEAIAKEIGGIFCEVNVMDDASVDAGLAKARAAHGQERILVNCAGTANAIKTISRDRETGAIKHFPLDAFTFIVQLNLIGTFRCIAKSAAGMVAADPLDDFGQRGVIINTASVAAEDGQIGQAAYSASKGGVVGMTLPIARDLMNEGIRVNTILPGIFETPLMKSLPEKAQESLAAAVPFPKRLGKPEEYAALALAMIENDYWNGEDVRLDGAIRMAPR